MTLSELILWAVRTRPDFVARFNRHIGRETDCWLWTGTTTFGYGQISLPRWRTDKFRLARTHRVAWALQNNHLTDDVLVCHMCDVRSCVNPEHLFVGTQTDNMRDCAAKNRIVRNALLTEQAVREIRVRALSEKTKDIAADYGVTSACIRDAVKGTRWGHVT